jgi:hypothetical protein
MEIANYNSYFRPAGRNNLGLSLIGLLAQAHIGLPLIPLPYKEDGPLQTLTAPCFCSRRRPLLWRPPPEGVPPEGLLHRVLEGWRRTPGGAPCAAVRRSGGRHRRALGLCAGARRRALGPWSGGRRRAPRVLWRRVPQGAGVRCCAKPRSRAAVHRVLEDAGGCCGRVNRRAPPQIQAEEMPNRRW